MTTRASIDDFLKQRTIAVVGASRDKRKFGNTLFRELRSKGYAAIPVNPHSLIFCAIGSISSLAHREVL